MNTSSLHHAQRLLSMAILLAAASMPFRAAVPAAAAETAQSTAKADERRLVGRWVRPDGGYILELKEIRKDGSLKAAYFNPRPINVAKAELFRRDGRATIFIELRDVNYPGSTYTLQYDPNSDRLQGIYFQAIQKQTYEIEFVRYR